MKKDEKPKLMSLNIDDIVNEAKEIDLINDKTNSPKKEIINKQTENVAKKTDDKIWNTFLDYGESTKNQQIKKEKKVTWIDEDIINTFKCCKVNKLAVTDMVNSALHAFIDHNKDNLRQYYKKNEILL